MVTDTVRHAERELALSYAPAAARAGLAAMLALDDRLGAIVRRATDPTIGLMRLTWWAEALAELEGGDPPAEPLLRSLVGQDGAALAATVDGWDRLLAAEPVDLAAFAEERGGRLFTVMARALGAEDARVAALGQGWALADLAGHWSDAQVASAARAMAKARLAAGLAGHRPKALRALSALGLLARSDLAGDAPGAPGRVARLAWHRLTGR